MHDNEALITRFYEAFAGLDHTAMAACYTPDARFSDPVFTDLDGDGVRAMWRMLCEGATSFELTFRDVRADDRSGSARWEATYLFSATGRTVHNVIDAEFELRDGLISRHTDRFDLWRWSRQALGLPGVMLGWSPIIRNQVRRGAGGQLAKFRERAGI